MLAAITTKKIRKNIKVIFDPRSPFPEENITANRWDASSFSYKLWKNLEKQFLKDSDITIAITNTYIEHFKKISPQSCFAIMPNNVDVKRFMPDDKLRMSLRAELRLNDDEIVFAYSGSLGNHWNNPNIYAKFIYMEILACPKCQDNQIIKSGIINSKQRYLCKKCNYFSERKQKRGHL